MKEVNVDIQDSEIEACHRLPKRPNVNGPSRTIIRLTNRRKCEKALRNRKGLFKAETLAKLNVRGQIYINESLCPAYRKLWYMCKLLYNDQKISRFWCSNGSLKIAIAGATDQDDERRHNIDHESNLKSLFRDFKFD